MAAQTDEENIAFARPWVERAHNVGIAVEVELGRLEGGEAGLRMTFDSKLTEPKKAEAFIIGHVVHNQSPRQLNRLGGITGLEQIYSHLALAISTGHI